MMKATDYRFPDNRSLRLQTIITKTTRKSIPGKKKVKTRPLSLYTLALRTRECEVLKTVKVFWSRVGTFDTTLIV